jgi:hypothetical protein
MFQCNVAPITASMEVHRPARMRTATRVFLDGSSRASERLRKRRILGEMHGD